MMKTKWFYGQIALLIVLFIAAPLLFVVFAALLPFIGIQLANINQLDKRC